MTLDELGAALEKLELARGTIVRELEEARACQERIGAFECDRDALLEACADASPEALECLGPRERHRLYRLLRLGVLVDADGSLSVSGVSGAASLGSF